MSARLPSPLRPRRQRGAALLTALLIVVLVTTLAAAMLWRQARSIQIEAADRGRAQADWVLQGALDWARLILREDKRANNKDNVDHLGEVWAVPLAEARLSSFLSTDDNKSADAGPDAFLSGHIEDAQSRFNLRNLVRGQAEDLRVAARIFQAAGLNAALAEQLRATLIGAVDPASAPQGRVPLLPARLEQLRWLGLSDEQAARLRSLAVILPQPTPVNLNTASREVITALFDGMDVGSADRIVRARQAKPFRTLEDVKPYLPQGLELSTERTGFTSDFFFVEGQLRLDDRVLAQRSLVQRRGLDMIVLDRERLQRQAGLPSGAGGGNGATP
ncbi:type II secretion system minor pseudopilin GspK [Mitsuaria sp. GD03876]|uniref:type II secretion system minor pseudopilin GspK n=1 Tax=Mitsuaria sp. GD03876 TaxID=2975399 RepID=UPI00244B5055|nr:type II secretion system minor pseudopilin GspK [Mitsuaria sp. GD03876]MDH0864182.1 type II secretion system minor pseudopilin GspK [Mitsuaria sp. GD03876]